MKRVKIKRSTGLIIRKRKGLTFTPIAIQIGTPPTPTKGNTQ